MTTDVPSGMRPEAEPPSAERRIVDALLDRAARDPATMSPYLRNHLTEHIGAINAWPLLTARPGLLDHLDAKQWRANCSAPDLVLSTYLRTFGLHS